MRAGPTLGRQAEQQAATRSQPLRQLPQEDFRVVGVFDGFEGNHRIKSRRGQGIQQTRFKLATGRCLRDETARKGNGVRVQIDAGIALHAAAIIEHLPAIASTRGAIQHTAQAGLGGGKTITRSMLHQGGIALHAGQEAAIADIAQLAGKAAVQHHHFVAARLHSHGAEHGGQRIKQGRRPSLQQRRQHPAAILLAIQGHQLENAARRIQPGGIKRLHDDHAVDTHHLAADCPRTQTVSALCPYLGLLPAHHLDGIELLFGHQHPVTALLQHMRQLRCIGTILAEYLGQHRIGGILGCPWRQQPGAMLL
ncbi:hypothetical protein DLM_4562 [Aquitalea magnusonii]|uniref:Uncharacterized protein n=1 Tax=Aquitalea magnusonii TaxID=332411 RepID=A0A3G9GJV7_9NEIS|nr:hypothetical protein DLM_4562 [Aquitalea magnusonii]